MNAKVIWILVGLVALFAGGVAAGILYQRGMPSVHRGFPEGRHDAAHFVDHFRQRLALSDEQAAEVKDVLDSLHKEMEGLMNGFHGNFTALRRRAWADIRATLSEKQRSEFDKLVEELEMEHSHH